MIRLNKFHLFAIAFLILNVSVIAKDIKKPFSFVQICDTQLGFIPENYKQDLETLRQTVKQVNQLNPDFVVICGDLVNQASDSTYSDFNKIKECFSMPCYCTPGNHDLGNIPNDTTLGFYRKTIGKDYYEFHNKGYSFIVTNSQLWKSYVAKESEKHDKWVKKALKKQHKKQRPIFVIGHYPLYVEDAEEKEAYFNLPPKKREELFSLFKQSNVLAYLSGHTHKTIINNYENIQLVSGETISVNFDKRPFGFRLWEVEADTVKQHFVALPIPGKN